MSSAPESTQEGNEMTTATMSYDYDTAIAAYSAQHERTGGAIDDFSIVVVETADSVIPFTTDPAGQAAAMAFAKANPGSSRCTLWGHEALGMS